MEGMTLAVSATAAWQSERNRLLGIAYRMLGDFGHAEDVVSEVAIDAVRQERRSGVDSWPAWLTTVCVRRSIDRVRQLATLREEYTGPWLPEPVLKSKQPLPFEAAQPEKAKEDEDLAADELAIDEDEEPSADEEVDLQTGDEDLGVATGDEDEEG